jgi:hypothetical protein
MLNLISSTHNAKLSSTQEVLLAVGLGLLWGLLGVLSLENDASQAMAHAFSLVPVAEPSLASQSVLKLPAASPDELAQAQKTSAANLPRLAFLERRQSQREDVTEVQEMWLLSRLGSTPSMVTLQSQQWLQGQFSWEGLAGQPIDLDNLVHTLNRFGRWHQAPVVMQMQSESTDKSAGQRKGLVFQLQAQLQAPLQTPLQTQLQAPSGSGL